MSKERLEEAIRAIKSNWPDERYSMLRDALDCVISEAERVETLEKREEVRKVGTEANSKYYGKIEQQNKRYREALEFYSDKENYRKLIIEGDKMILGKMIIEEDNGDKAHKALESEK